MQSIETIIERLAALPGTDALFNPYGPLEDPLAGARRANLRRFLTMLYERHARVLLLAEAPGYRGCAWTGIPVTSERIMLAGGDRWGLFGEGYWATSGVPGGVAEMSATILWGALTEAASEPPVIWNTCPLHPHRPGERRSNRTPPRSEQVIGLPFIRLLLEMFDFEQIGAVGRIAQANLAALEVAYIPLRHPAQGGKNEFVAGLHRLLVG
ncbi:MAG: uracil-DNA glycosylase [Anaerolineae bacterium]|nr:uracil-DNA glycosylase [Anaerolineae bacterium]